MAGQPIRHAVKRRIKNTWFDLKPHVQVIQQLGERLANDPYGRLEAVDVSTGHRRTPNPAAQSTPVRNSSPSLAAHSYALISGSPPRPVRTTPPTSALGWLRSRTTNAAFSRQRPAPPAPSSTFTGSGNRRHSPQRSPRPLSLLGQTSNQRFPTNVGIA